MNNRPAFTIIELLIAITLSSFIMLGLMQLYQGVIRYLESTRDMMATNRKVCLLFNQLERDISSAYIPTLAKLEKGAEEQPPAQNAEKKPEPAPAQTPEEKKKEEALEEEQRKSFFVGTIDEQFEDIIKIDGKRFQQCKTISMICSSPLQVYGERKPRLVRVIYELVRDKTKSTRDVNSYQLLRKETDDLLNAMGKIDPFAPPQPGKAIREHIVAQDVKGLFFQYIITEEEKREAGSSKVPQTKQILSFKWGDKKENQGIVPEKILVWIDFWDAKKIKSSRFHALFPVLSFPTRKEDEKQKENEAAKTPSSTDPAKPQNPELPPGDPTLTGAS